MKTSMRWKRWFVVGFGALVLLGGFLVVKDVRQGRAKRKTRWAQTAALGLMRKEREMWTGSHVPFQCGYCAQAMDRGIGILEKADGPIPPQLVMAYWGHWGNTKQQALVLTWLESGTEVPRLRLNDRLGALGDFDCLSFAPDEIKEWARLDYRVAPDITVCERGDPAPDAGVPGPAGGITITLPRRPEAPITVQLLYGDHQSSPSATVYMIDAHPDLRRQQAVHVKAINWTNSLGMRFARIAAGDFDMGVPGNDPERTERLHHVKLTRPFLLATTLVTVGQFTAFVKETAYKTDAEQQGWAYVADGTKVKMMKGATWRTPGFAQADDCPVVEVSWNDATAFCAWLSRKEGRSYRLPTEAEWEFAAQAGIETDYWWGNNPDDGVGCANCADQTAKGKIPNDGKLFVWSDGYVFTSPVGKFKPNAWDLYDMAGNVWEWCADSVNWRKDYPPGDAIDPHGSPHGGFRVLRGGSWNTGPRYCRCASRKFSAPDDCNDISGFRVVLDSEPPHEGG